MVRTLEVSDKQVQSSTAVQPSALSKCLATFYGPHIWTSVLKTEACSDSVSTEQYSGRYLVSLDQSGLALQYKFTPSETCILLRTGFRMIRCFRCVRNQNLSCPSVRPHVTTSETISKNGVAYCE
jgi:hypothetical protein